MNLSKSLLDKLIRRKIIWYEKLRGLDFTRTVDSKTLRLDHFEGDVFYAATLSRDLIEVLDVISIPEGSRILDFGAGKGAAMKIMQKYNFLEVAGVEISGDLEVRPRNEPNPPLRGFSKTSHLTSAYDFVPEATKTPPLLKL